MKLIPGSSTGFQNTYDFGKSVLVAQSPNQDCHGYLASSAHANEVPLTQSLFSDV